MKIIIVFLCFVVAVLTHHLPESERQFLAQVHRACQSDPKTFCDEDKLRNLNNHINDRQAGIHMRCMAVKAGLMKHNGELDIAIIRDKITLVSHEKSRVDGYVQKCAKKIGNPEKTANLLWLCFIQNGIEYYHKL